MQLIVESNGIGLFLFKKTFSHVLNWSATQSRENPWLFLILDKMWVALHSSVSFCSYMNPPSLLTVSGKAELYCTSEKPLVHISVVAVSPSMEEFFSWENVGLGTSYILTLYHTQRDIPQGLFPCQIPEIYAWIHQKGVWPGLLNNKLCAVPFMHIQKKAFLPHP